MRFNKLKVLTLLLGLFTLGAFADKPSFRHVGFYLHEGWFFNYPFAVRTWQRDDFKNMFMLLNRMGYDRVGIWPMLEAIPMPLHKEDQLALNEFRKTIDDAHAATLECWLMQCPNLTPDSSVLSKPWKQRNPYHNWKNIRMDDPVAAEPYLAHRTAMMAILNNADAYVTIDGDPGGYAGARPDDWLKEFLSDRAAIDRYGVNPSRQRLIPWIWSGWGTKSVWGGNPSNPPALIKPFTAAEMKLFKTAMPEPWELLPGRSHRSDWANGRVNIELADSLGLINRSTLLCYEAIEFEPTPPATILQFELIRQILKQESKYAGLASGVFGNAQQPVMVLPNIYFFARGSRELNYLSKSDEEVLKDFAGFLGGPAEILIPAWQCLSRDLKTLPADLPQRLKKTRLMNEPAKYIPGGPDRYLEILSKETDCRIKLLQATSEPATSDEHAAKRIAEGLEALIDWWNVHHYVNDGNGDEPFNLHFVNGTQVSLLRKWCHANVSHPARVGKLTTDILIKDQALSEQQILNVLSSLLPK